MAEKHKQALRFPLQVNGTPISEISYRDVTVRDVLVAAELPGGDVGKSIRIAASVTEMPEAHIKDMDGADFTKLSKALEANQQPVARELVNVTLKRPKAGDFELMDGPLGEFRKSVLFTERVSGLSFDELMDMRAAHFNTLQQELMGFFS